MILFFVILPFTTTILGKRLRLSAKATALVIMACSLLFLIIGCVLMGFSSTNALFFVALVIYTLGSGFSVTSQSYIADCAQKDRLASVLAVLSVAVTAGKVGASALWPALLGVGLQWGTEFGKGLPSKCFTMWAVCMQTNRVCVSVRCCYWLRYSGLGHRFRCLQWSKQINA